MALDPNVQLIYGGVDSFAKGLQPAIDQERAEAARNRPLSGYEKWLGKVLSGELTPEQAAVHAKLETQGGMPQPQAQPGVASPMAGLSANPQAVSNQATPSEAFQPQRISQVSGPVSQGVGGLGAGLQAPQTAGDMQALMGAAPFLRTMNRGPTQDQLSLELLKEQGRMNRNAQNIGSRENIWGARMDQGGQQFDQTLQYKYDALNALNQRAQRLHALMSQRAGSANDLKLLQIMNQKLGNALNSLSRVQAAGAYYLSPQASGQLQQIQMQADQALQEYEQFESMMVPKYAPGQPASTGAPSVSTSITTQGGQQTTAPAAPQRSRLGNLFGK